MPRPAQNKHKRRPPKSSKGRNPQISPVNVTITPSGAVATLDFSAPVVVRSMINLAVTTLAPINQAIASPTQVLITFSGALSGHAYELPSPPAGVSSTTGGPVLGSIGTF